MRWLTFASSICFLSISAANAAETSSEAANRSVIETQIAEMNSGDWRTALNVYDARSRNFGRPVGKATLARIFQDIYATFPDWHMRIEDIVAVGDSVIVRAMTTGTDRGVGQIPVNGGMLVGVPPTQKHFAAEAIHWYKVRDGVILDHYATRDDLGMMEQLGLSPSPKPFDWRAFAAAANRH